MQTVVTSFSPDGYEKYGKAFIESYREFWPLHIRLICYWEGVQPEGVEGFDLLDTEPAASFIERHKNNPVIAGDEMLPTWGAKAKKKGHSFKNDAYKFARKVFAVCHAAKERKRGRLFWIDADTITRTMFPEKLLYKLLPDGASLCYLHRPAYHSELGFVGYNLDRIETHEFLKAYEGRYALDLFLDDPAWDDCHQFDYLVERLDPSVRHIPFPPTERDQPFDHSPLGRYMTHFKGRRKDTL